MFTFGLYCAEIDSRKSEFTHNVLVLRLEGFFAMEAGYPAFIVRGLGVSSTRSVLPSRALHLRSG